MSFSVSDGIIFYVQLYPPINIMYTILKVLFYFGGKQNLVNKDSLVK